MLCGIVNIVLLVMNLIFMVGAILILTYGAPAPKEYEFRYVSKICYFVGISLIFTSIFGTFIACIAKCRLIPIYVLAISVCVLGEIAIGIIGTTHHDMVEKEKVYTLLKLYMNYETDPTSMKEIDHMQHKYECCGNIDDDFYVIKTIPKNDPQNRTILISSCCPPEVKICERHHAYHDICPTIIAKYEEKNLKKLSIIGWFFGIEGMVSMVVINVLNLFSCFL